MLYEELGTRICESCDRPFTPSVRGGRYCSVNCSVKGHKRRQKQRRLERLRAARNGKVNYVEIHERDKWVCQICGDKIEGHYDCKNPLSLTYDHRIPLSRGGLHSTQNLQMTHLICNTQKGNRIAMHSEGGMPPDDGG